MGGKSKAPPPPDYSGVAAASEASAKYSFELGKEQLDFFKKQYADNKLVSDEVIDFAMGVMERNDYNAQQDRQRYETIFQPLEEQLAKEAEEYSSPERMEHEAGKAEADVAQQFEQARSTAQQRLEAYGVDPSQTRAGALDAQSRLAEAAAQSSAGNQARERTEQTGRALRSEAINIGKGYPGQIAGQYGTAQQSGNQATNTGLATTASAAQTMGTPGQWQGLGNQAVGQWGNTLNMGYQNQLDAFKANQQSSSGWGGIGGQLVGAALGAFMEDGGAIPTRRMQAGGPPDTPPNMSAPVIPPPPAGNEIPPEASPSRGAITDDVSMPVSDGGEAKLNVGEFVLPEDVARWYGEEKLQKMIQKARAAKETAPAQPEFGPPGQAPPGNPEGNPPMPPPGAMPPAQMYNGGAIPARGGW